jgi:type III secretion system FlhB-like substrate exporter
MSWLSQRQVVLSHNIANAATPDDRAKDLRLADFHPPGRGLRRSAGQARDGADRARPPRGPGSASPAKDSGALAERIRAIAQDHGVPIVRNPPLARALHGAVELGVEVPAAHCRAIAEVIGYLLRLKRRS